MSTNRRTFLKRNFIAASLATTAISCAQNSTAPANPQSGTSSIKPSAKPQQWPQFRGDELASGVAQSCLPDKLDVLWKYKVKDGAFDATPAIIDGVCYVPDLDGEWHALDIHTGDVKWTKKTEAFSFAASPAFRDGKLFVGDIDGIFYCYDLKGKELWRFTAGAEISASATFYKDNVLFASQDATLYCLNQKTGKLAWKIEVQDQIQCSPTVVGDRSFVAGCDGHLHIMDLIAGKEVAAIEIDSPTGVTPAVMGDHVYFGTEAGEVFKINWKEATVGWRFTEKRRREIRSSAAVTDKMVVVGSRSKNVYGIDPKTGLEIWKFTGRHGIESSPLIACDRVFIASNRGRLHLLDLMTGKEIWKKETGDSFSSSPAAVNGKLVITSGEGVVYCLGAPEKA